MKYPLTRTYFLFCLFYCRWLWYRQLTHLTQTLFSHPPGRGRTGERRRQSTHLLPLSFANTKFIYLETSVMMKIFSHHPVWRIWRRSSFECSLNGIIEPIIVKRPGETLKNWLLYFRDDHRVRLLFLQMNFPITEWRHRHATFGPSCGLST